MDARALNCILFSGGNIDNRTISDPVFFSLGIDHIIHQTRGDL